MRVDEPGHRAAEQRAHRAPEQGDQSGLENDRRQHRSPGDTEKAKCRHVAPPLFHLEQHDAEQEDCAGKDGDDSDRPMKSADHLKGPRRLDGDIARTVSAKPEGNVIDPLERVVGRAGAAGCDRESVDAIPVVCEGLEVSKVEPNAILRPRDLCRIGAPSRDRHDPDGIAGRIWGGCDHHALADGDSRVGCQSLIDRDPAFNGLRGEREQEYVQHGSGIRKANGQGVKPIVLRTATPVALRGCAVVTGIAVLASCGDPAVQRNQDYQPPTVEMGANGRVVHNASARERWILRSGIPSRPAWLFSGVLAAARDDAGNQAVLRPAGDRMLLFDSTGKSIRTDADVEFTRAVAIAWAASRWLVADRDGRVVRVGDDTGGVALETPFARPTIAAFGDGLIAARSPFATGTFREAPATPLLVALSVGGQISASLDTAARPADPGLASISNAGHVAGTDSLAFFAFLTRDEVRAYDLAGRRRWTADRSLAWPRPPSATPGAGAAGLRYHSVNLAIAVRDAFVYVLAFDDSARTIMRLDAFEAETGVLARTVAFPATMALLSLDEKGAVWSAPADTLDVIGAPPRLTIVDFRLPTPAGDTIDSHSLRGKVVLLNLWASWCEPCRDEFPLMAHLARALPPEDFTIVAVSEDRDENAARRFLGEFSPPFQIAWGRGALDTTLRFRGLPFTVLLDRDGVIIQRYVGFGGPSQFARMRTDIERAIANR